MIRTGLWQNENGSHLDLKIKEDSLEGQYMTNSDNPNLQKWFPVKGYINNNLIGFCVSWENNHSITSWCGKYIPETDTIKCHWHLVRAYRYEAEKADLWESFLTGIDLFTFKK